MRTHSEKYLNQSWAFGIAAFTLLGYIVGIDVVKASGIDLGWDTPTEAATVGVAAVFACMLAGLSVAAKNAADGLKKHNL